MIRRWRWAIGLVALLALGLGAAFWPARTPVDLGRITRGPMAVGVTDDGVTRAEEYYIVSAPVTGYLSRIELEPGDLVARNTLVATMTGRPSPPLDLRSIQETRSALAAAQAAAAAATASLAQARRDAARAEDLAQRGFLPRAQLEAARTRVVTGEASLQQARAEAGRLQAALARPAGPDFTTPVAVRSPAKGSVLSVINESEGVIAEGTPLVTVGDPDRIEAVVDLLSREAVRVSQGDRVEVRQWGGTETLVGYVKRVEPFGRLKVSALGIEEQRVNVIVGFSGGDRTSIARLGHGFQIDATIVLWSANNALRVPVGALFRGANGEWATYVDERGRAKLRAVQIGHMDDEFGEVRGGLEEGERVILNPSSSLRDNMRIKAR